MAEDWHKTICARIRGCDWQTSRRKGSLQLSSTGTSAPPHRSARAFASQYHTRTHLYHTDNVHFYRTPKGRMHHHMPPTNPRKRQAPGSPAPQAPSSTMQQGYNAPSQLSNADFLKWGSLPENNGYPDAMPYNINNNYNGAPIAQPKYESPSPAPSTQLARRPMNRQLVNTGPRNTYDNMIDPWGQFGDESILDPQNPTSMEDSMNDNIEELEAKAVVAKRDSQAKRKQIPPFVQKLSRYASSPYCYRRISGQCCYELWPRIKSHLTLCNTH